MPTELKETVVGTLGEYMNFVEQQGTRWYRGCGDASYKLIPSLYRHPQGKTSASLLELESSIIKRFKQRSMPYLSAPLRENDDLSSLFLMQHFGIPTRLLDWTENPYIALYFALAGARYKRRKTGSQYQVDVTIWSLDPDVWNGKALDFDPSPGVISPPDEDLLNGYLPTESVGHRKPEPVALYGVYNSQRIVAQRGVFTLFGTSVKPMEQSYKDNDYPQNCLLKLKIEKSNIGNMLSALVKIGFTDSVVYPDLTGLAKEIKRYFGFWV